MHAHLVAPIAEVTVGERIVKVLSVGRVNGKRRHLAKVLSLCQLLLGNLSRKSLRLVNSCLWVVVVYIVLSQYGAHLGVVVARLAEYLEDTPRGYLVRARPVGDSHLHLGVSLSAV